MSNECPFQMMLFNLPIPIKINSTKNNDVSPTDVAKDV